MSHRESPASNVDERLRQIVTILLTSGGCHPDIHLVAGRMGTTVRTLQRRLRATGVTYAGVVQQTRCAAARQLLAAGQRRISEVARMLGYSDPAHFTRAFRRWTGTTPRDFRPGA